MTFSPRNFPETDPRLLGSWKSDLRRTFRDWNWKSNTSPKKRDRLKSLFGKSMVTFTQTKTILNLPHRDWQTSRHYSILGIDETSVAIMEFGELEIKNKHKYWTEGVKMVKEFCSKPVIKHIHFENDYYWLSIGTGKNREFFKRLKRTR